MFLGWGCLRFLVAHPHLEMRNPPPLCQKATHKTNFLDTPRFRSITRRTVASRFAEPQPGPSRINCNRLQFTNCRGGSEMKTAVRSILFLASLSATLAYAQTTFQHIIVIVQENRTPDNLFQGLCGSSGSLCPSPYNISPNGVAPPSGAPIALTPDPLFDDL